MKKIETKTAQTILEKPTEIRIAGQTYQALPPTLGTLILLSEQIADIPFEEFDKGKSMCDFFKLSKHNIRIAKGLAIMILGSEKVLYLNKEKPTFWQKIIRKKPQNELSSLTEKIIHQMPISQMIITFTTLLGQTHVADFLTLITFLQDTNVLKPTREVSQTIAFGQ